jgi:hypothetical protein
MRSLAAALLAIGTLFALTGCGHPATRAECDELFDKTARIELMAQHIKDPVIVEKRVAEARASSGADFEKSCLSKRITSSALVCVRKASTAFEFDKCLD